MYPIQLTEAKMKKFLLTDMLKNHLYKLILLQVQK